MYYGTFMVAELRFTIRGWLVNPQDIVTTTGTTMEQEPTMRVTGRKRASLR